MYELKEYCMYIDLWYSNSSCQYISTYICMYVRVKWITVCLIGLAALPVAFSIWYWCLLRFIKFNSIPIYFILLNLSLLFANSLVIVIDKSLLCYSNLLFSDWYLISLAYTYFNRLILYNHACNGYNNVLQLYPINS